MPTIVAIDIGGTTVKLALVRTDDDPTTPHEILIHDKVDTGAKDPGEQIVARIAQGVRRMTEKTGEKPVGAGAGCPGLIDNKKGIVITAGNLPTFRDFPLAAQIEKQLGIPTAIHNDAKAAILGEFNFGPNKGTQNMVLLTLGTGIGGGVITGGRLLTGADNAATELGHVKVEYHEPAPCTCGKHGCIEAYAGMAGIRRIATGALAGKAASTLDPSDLTTKSIDRAARGGDAIARKIFHSVGQYLGRGIAHFIDIFNPERVVLAGGASRATDLLMPGIQESLLQYCSFDFTRNRAQVLATSMPDDINVLGAAAVFLNAGL
jgi:glucokinase